MTEQPYVARFTPGPWKAAFDAVGYVRAVYTVADEQIAEVWGVASQPEPSNQAKANAALIAAAPDLYAALHYAETVMMIVQPRSHTHEYLACLEQARAALAKAVPHTVAERENDTLNTDSSPNQTAATEQPELGMVMPEGEQE